MTTAYDMPEPPIDPPDDRRAADYVDRPTEWGCPECDHTWTGARWESECPECEHEDCEVLT